MKARLWKIDAMSTVRQCLTKFTFAKDSWVILYTECDVTDANLATCSTSVDFLAALELEEDDAADILLQPVEVHRAWTQVDLKLTIPACRVHSHPCRRELTPLSPSCSLKCQPHQNMEPTQVTQNSYGGVTLLFRTIWAKHTYVYSMSTSTVEFCFNCASGAPQASQYILSD